MQLGQAYVEITDRKILIFGYWVLDIGEETRLNSSKINLPVG